MSKVDTTLSADDIIKYASKPWGIIQSCRSSSAGTVYDWSQYTNQAYQVATRLGTNSYINDGYINININMTSFNHSYRICGLILDENDDGSYRIALISNGILRWKSNGNMHSYGGIRLEANTHVIVDEGDLPYTIDYGHHVYPKSTTNMYAYRSYHISSSYGITPNITSSEIISELDSYNYDFSKSVTVDDRLYLSSLTGNMLYGGIQYDGINGSVGLTNQSEKQLTTDINSTMIIGTPYNTRWISDYDSVDRDLKTANGNLSSNVSSRLLGPNYNDLNKLDKLKSDTSLVVGSGKTVPLGGVEFDRHAYGMLTTNLILTHQLDYALDWVNNGVIPPDATIDYPIDDYNDIQIRDGGDDGENNENGDNTRETTPTPMVTPTFTPQSITNTNLYWLTISELDDFFNWFWSDAGAVGEMTDLWEKIQGMYENLSQAVLNVRFMPINIDWVGGSMRVDKIRVGQISKDGNIEAVNKANPIIRDVGNVDITEHYKSFCDYSPYAQLSLYLPFYGFIDLDINLFMQHNLSIKCVYDIMSGTIQYCIYCDDYMVNSMTAKMATDVPITLQSKNDRDSAIFNNVSNATSTLLSGTIAVSGGNPIGLTTAIQGISGADVSSIPLAVKGTVGETGAFYAPQKCAIYLRRPSYNRPSTYATNVGYPCNKSYKLANLSGFTTCYNPKLDFSSSDVKLTDDEITELYDTLEKGVYL